MKTIPSFPFAKPSSTAAPTNRPAKAAPTNSASTSTRTPQAARPPFVARWRNSRRKLLSMYPEYDRGTRRLARHFGVKPDELLLTNGGDDALRLFFDAFVDAGTDVVICEPTFPMYRYWGEVAGAKIEVHCATDQRLNFPSKASCTRWHANPRVLFVCNPNNPDRHARRQVDDRNNSESRATHRRRHRRSLRRILRRHRRSPGSINIRNSSSRAHSQKPPDSRAFVSARSSRAPTRSRILRRATAPFPVNLAALVAAEAAVARSANHEALREKHPPHSARGSKRNCTSSVSRPIRAPEIFSSQISVAAGPDLSPVSQSRKSSCRDRSKDIGPGFVRVTIGTQKEMERLLKLIKRFS